MGSDSCYNAILEDPPCILPRVLIVSRRTLRKNKFVDFVGEYHLDLIVRYGAIPIIVPRVSGIHGLLENFQPIHGVLLCEGEDISPIHYDTSASTHSQSNLQQVKSTHASDTALDPEKDLIELTLTRLCLDRNIPFLGICRGSQVLNVACGGTLYQDVETELGAKVAHIDYGNYDGNRHAARMVESTPLFDWFGGRREVMVNSYHHQGVKRLAERFVPMAFALDGLVEGFYDPEFYDPDDGKFVMGLQFHPERMRRIGSDEFEYVGCPMAYQEFVKAVIAYRKKLDNEMENRRKFTIPSIHVHKYPNSFKKESEVVAQELLLGSNMALMEENIEAKEVAARNVMEKCHLKNCFHFIQ